ncbi:MAG: hypothetical protein LBV08_07560, partial [Clostridiales bacterium]|nr:hypothetical protein [Clostridiales bacterium]
AQAELAKINFTSVLINIPLEENEKAKEAAIAEVKLAMEGKVSEGYTIDFAATGYENKILSGTFTVTSKGYPLLDTAAESRDITVGTSWLPTAQRELDKIDVPSVSILVSLLRNDSRDQAVNQVISQARAQVLEGYSVDFEWTDYSVKGTVSGKFTVTNDAYPFDTATGDEKIITVSYTPNALGELGKIRVSEVPVSVPTSEGAAQEQAFARAAAIAQKQVSPGYNVTYKSASYLNTSPDNTTAEMEGKFTVTSATDPGDRSEDSAARKMNAVFTSAAQEADKIKVPFAPHDAHSALYDDLQMGSVGAFYYRSQARVQVMQGYSLSFNYEGWDERGHFGTLILTNDNYPEDTVERFLKIPLVQIIDPPAAKAELDKIKLNVETINIDSPISAESMLAAAVEAAQAQAAPGYTVFLDLIRDGGSFITATLVVSNNDMPTDTAEIYCIISAIYTPPTASSELVKISVPSVTITVPPGHASAQPAAVARAELAAQAQIKPEYTVAFTPTSDSDGILLGKFTVSNAGDSAEDDVERTVAVNYALSTAADELVKINVPLMSVTIPLDDGGAADEAVAAVMLAVQKQITPGYAVTFIREGSTVAGGVLSGRFSVTNESDPYDTAEDATNRTIEIRYTTASEVRKEIDISSITIDIPVELPIVSRNAFVSRAIELARAQVTPGYTVSLSFLKNESYNQDGKGRVYFTVTNDNNPADTSEDSEDPYPNYRRIFVDSTYVREAKDELVKINVPGVNVGVPLDDSGALDEAVSDAEAGAQRMIIAGFTAKFTPTGKIADDGTLTGRFTVTNNDFPIDTATYETDWTITVSSTV